MALPRMPLRTASAVTFFHALGYPIGNGRGRHDADGRIGAALRAGGRHPGRLDPTVERTVAEGPPAGSRPGDRGADAGRAVLLLVRGSAARGTRGALRGA